MTHMNVGKHLNTDYSGMSRGKLTIKQCTCIRGSTKPESNPYENGQTNFINTNFLFIFGMFPHLV